MNVLLTWKRQIVIDYQWYSFNINTTSSQICSDQYSTIAISKVAHNLLPLRLWHITVHGTYRELLLDHFLRQLLHLFTGIAEHHRVRHRQWVINVNQCVKLIFLLINRNKILHNAIHRNLITLDENANWLGHKFFCHIKYIGRKCGTYQNHLQWWH